MSTGPEHPSPTPDPAPPTPHPPTPDPAAGERPTGWRALRTGRRDRLAAALIGVLTLLLGFAFAVQVRSTDGEEAYRGAREEDLVSILDDVDAQEDRLREQIAEQRSVLEQLSSSDSQATTALAEARERAQSLGILNGTIAAQGPGLVMAVRDPEGRVTPAMLLNAVQELRGAGAETMQIDDVRVGVSTAITGSAGALEVDGQPVRAPYVVEVIGPAQDMATAMGIPGGVVNEVRSNAGGTVDIDQSDRVLVDALRPLDTPQYADPVGAD